jgi:hypothetical protein
MTGGVFISYRRDDSGGYAGRIYDRLTSRLGRENVFFDVDTIPIGRDFVDALSENIGKCDALLAVIGKHWVTSVDSDNRRRLDDPADFVRIEIEAALSRDVPVVPVLVDGAKMPRPEDLPPGLQKLIRRQAVEISHARFDTDAERLTTALAEIEDETRRREGKPTRNAEALKSTPAETRAIEAAAAAATGAGASEFSSAVSLKLAIPGGARPLLYLAIAGLVVAAAGAALFAEFGTQRPETTADARPAAVSLPAEPRPDGATALVEDAAASICNAAAGAKGNDADAEVRAAVFSELGALLANIAAAKPSATATLSHDAFAALAKDATAIARSGDPQCRPAIVATVVAAIGASSNAVTVTTGNCSIAANGNATGNSIVCGVPAGAASK